jgi:hypothetical protein
MQRLPDSLANKRLRIIKTKINTLVVTKTPKNGVAKTIRYWEHEA